MLTAGTIINGGLALLRERIGAVGIWALLYFAMSAALSFIIRPFMLDMMVQQGRIAAGGQPDPAAMLAWVGPLSLVYVVLLVAMTVLFTAGLRAKFNPTDDAIVYLRLGMDEARIIGTAVLLGLAFLVLYVALVLVMAIVAGLLAVLIRDLVIPVVVLAIFAILAALVYFQVRFSLAFALTLLRGRITIGESWRLTRKRFWTLFGGYLVLGLLVVAVSIGLAMLTQGQYVMDIIKAGTDPVARAAAQQHQLQRQFGEITPLTMFGWALGAVLGAGWIAVAAGGVGSATLALLDDEYGKVAVGHTVLER